jgi:hypothetical protein
MYSYVEFCILPSSVFPNLSYMEEPPQNNFLHPEEPFLLNIFTGQGTKRQSW